MEVYLPIAEVSVNILLILFLSLFVGLLSGIFGVGGGFLMTPFLIFMGIPPTYAVANEANNILASSTSGSLTHWFKDTLDYKMGSMIVLGGIVGTLLGIYIFTYFKEMGKIDIIITLAYMYVLVVIGSTMFADGMEEIDRNKKKIIIKKKMHTHYWIHGLPFKIRFKKSKVYESALVPILLGLIVGFIAAIMGVGGAFLMVPAMIYLIGMPTKLVPGTSLFVTIFITAFVTISHAFSYGTIDLILVLILIVGSITGVQMGQKVGQKLKASELKASLALLMLIVGILMPYDTFFRDHSVKINSSETNITFLENSQLYETIVNLSINHPITYGLFSIIIAIGLGIFASVLRKFVSKYRKKSLLKTA